MIQRTAHTCLALTLLMVTQIFSQNVHAEESTGMPRWIEVYSNGALKIDQEIYASIVHYNNKWQQSIQSSSSMRSLIRDKNTISGKFYLQGGQSLQLKESISPHPKGVLYSAHLINKDKAIATNQLCVSFNLPIAKFGGKDLLINKEKFTLPEKDKFAKTVVISSKATSIIIPVNKGRFEISSDTPIQFLLQDNRKYKSSTFSLRIFFNPYKGTITNSALKMNLRIIPFNATPLNLKKVANRAFSDNQANDGKGGWTDQGPENDLRMIKAGTKNFNGIPFNIIPANSNNNKSCIVLSDNRGKNFPTQLKINTDNKRYNYLYFLHTAAWAKNNLIYGKAIVQYNDGNTETIDVQGGRDISDWWSAYPLSNGAVVWTAENRSTYVGLYMSKFKVQNKPIKDIQLMAKNGAMWMIVGITGAVDDIPLPLDDSEYYIVENNDWKPFTHSLDVIKGSALDLSFLADAPAGKHGRVIIHNGKFAFSDTPKEPIRFYGSNLCFSANFPEKRDSEKLAENFARYGYNSVRIHHHDQGMINPNAPDSLTLNKEQIDKLDYLFYCMKKQGIYVTTDIYVSRMLKPTETGIYPESSRRVKALVPTSELVMKNIKAFAKKWLEHVNPYTHIAWKDDPALYSLSFINENTLYSVWKSTPETSQVYQAEMKKWIKANNIPYGNEAEKEAALCRFSTQMQIKSYRELRDYVKDELGCQALYSDCNMQEFRAQQIARNHFDYVDNHGYWDHPKFPVKPWRLPYGFQNTSVLSRYCSLPAKQMPSRIFGKPFTFTEFNYVFPNIYRSEGNAVMGAYASLQDWDAVYRFAFAHNLKHATSVQPAKGFDVSTDPISLLGERIVSLMFLRGDVGNAKKIAPYVMTDNILSLPGSGTNSSGFGNNYPKLGLIHQIGTIVIDKNFPSKPNVAFYTGMENFKNLLPQTPKYFKDNNSLFEQLTLNKLLPQKYYNPTTQQYSSDTGEITLFPMQKKLIVTNPRSECVVIPSGTNTKGKFMDVTGNDAFSTIFVASIDGGDLTHSKRLLLLHLTDIKNTQTKYANKTMTLLENPGKLPHLLKRGSAQITLKIPEEKSLQVWAIDITGKRLGKVESNNNNFTIQTHGKYGQVMAYEVIIK